MLKAPACLSNYLFKLFCINFCDIYAPVLGNKVWGDTTRYVVKYRSYTKLSERQKQTATRKRIRGCVALCKGIQLTAGFRISSFGFQIPSFRLKVSSFGFQIPRFTLRIPRFRFRILRFGSQFNALEPGFLALVTES